MDPTTVTALATTGLQVASNIFGNKAKKNAAKKQYQYQLALQHDAQNWQENMSNTAHQREVDDLKAAGLNPVLSASGNGASTGSVGAGEAQMAQQDAPDFMNAINTAKQAELADAQKQNLKADAVLKQKQGAKNESEKNLIDIQSKLEPQVKNAKIRLDNANSSKARQDIQESISRELANDISNKMHTMDLEKRDKMFWAELDLYKKEIENKLIEEGFDQSTIGLIIKTIGKTMNAASPFVEHHGGNTYHFNTN